MKKFDSILKKSADIRDFKSFDADAEWNQFVSIIGESESFDKELITKDNDFAKESNYHIIYMLAFAASMILVFSALFLFRKSEVVHAELITSSEPKSIELMDGTKIFVDPLSSVQYYTSLHQQNFRSVNLKGGAVFEVSHSILPFKVFFEDIFIEVLGTSFKIAKSKDTIVIKNINGSVRVAELKNNNNYKILNKGDIFHYVSGVFLNPNEVIETKSTVQKPSGQLIVKNSMVKPDKNISGKVRRFTLESVIKNYLIKFNKKKIKLDKKSKPDLNLIVIIDDINKPYLAILEDLKKQGIIDFVVGDCSDCYIIKAPQKK